MKGEVVYLYAFDVANEIVTSKVQEILAHKTTRSQFITDHTLPKDVPLYKPLAIETTSLPVSFKKHPLHPIIHMYEIGVLSITIRIPFETSHFHNLLPYHTPILDNGQLLGHVARDLCIETCNNIKDAMVQSSAPLESEAYTVFCLTDIGNSKNLQEWFLQKREAIADLLTENKSGVLSKMQVNEVLRIHYSYTDTDLTILDWDAALVIDQKGNVDDILYVLELANIQLEEYRALDQRLDRYLDKAYQDIRHHRFQLFGTYATILRNLRTLRIDVTKLNDEVTHITKFFGDWYIAHVYKGAHERFYLNQWRNSVEERLKQMDTLYSVAHTETANRKMLWLEMLIVIFFAIDLIAIFFFNK